MNPLLFTDVIPELPESWGSFQMLHGIAHDEVYKRMLEADLVPFFPPLWDFPDVRPERDEQMENYLLDHYLAHQSNAFLLGLPSIPDLSAVDLADPGARLDWLQLHAQVHANENAILGIT